MAHTVLAENASKAIVAYLQGYHIDLKDESDDCWDTAFDIATVIDEEWAKLGGPK